MAAGEQQGGDWGFEIRVADERRKQMRFHVVDADGGDAEAGGEEAAEGRADHECTDEAGAGGEGNAAEFPRGAACLLEDLCHQRHDLLDVVPGGELRHHAAALGVQFHLAVERLRAQTLVAVVEGDAGLVAGSLDAEH